MSPRAALHISRIQSAALVVGIIGLAVSALGAFADRKQFFFSYLFACLFWLGLSFGCFTVSMVHTLTGGRWGYPTRRFLEASFMVLPLMFILFIPVFFGLSDLYPWAQAGATSDSVLQERRPYQNVWGFTARTSLCFVVCIWMARYLRKWSLEQDATTDASPTRKARTLSGPGVVIYALVATFVYVDWIMALEKRWYSTMFPVIILIGHILTAYGFSVIMLGLFRKDQVLAGVLTRTHYHQLGNLLLTFVLFWTYVSFGQLLIIYSGDLPRELDWYLHRIAGNWKWVVGALALFHFFVPFILLLFRGTKQQFKALAAVAVLLLTMRVVDTYWLVMPSLHQQGLSISWMDFTAPLGIGGVWVSFFLSRLKRAALLPQHDPGLQFSFAYGH